MSKDILPGMPEIAPEDSLIQYPCDFPIKVMGINHPGIVLTLVEIVKRHDPDFKDDTVEIRPSKKGNYVGLTFTIRASSREQLDSTYRDLHAHEFVRVVL